MVVVTPVSAGEAQEMLSTLVYDGLGMVAAIDEIIRQARIRLDRQ